MIGAIESIANIFMLGLAEIAAYGLIFSLFILLTIGPFAIPAGYAINLWVKRGWQVAVSFLTTATILLSLNYYTGYRLQLAAAAMRKRRGVDLTFLHFSFYGLIISILLVVAWALFPTFRRRFVKEQNTIPRGGR